MKARRYLVLMTLLAGIITGAMAVRMTSGRKEALEFVDRRIDNVMQFEKAKAKWTNKNLNVEAYKETKTHIVKDVSEIQELLDDHLFVRHAQPDHAGAQRSGTSGTGLQRGQCNQRGGVRHRLPPFRWRHARG